MTWKNWLFSLLFCGLFFSCCYHYDNFPAFFHKNGCTMPKYGQSFIFELQTQICTFWANFKFQIRKHYYFCWYQQFYGGFTKLESILSVFACFLLLFSNFCCTLSTLCSVTLLVTEENVWYLHNFQIISSYVSHFCPNYMVRYFSYVY